MGNVNRYMLLHFCVLLFSFTSVFAKAAANAFNEGGITNKMFLLFCFLMIANCMVYAVFWQIVIKKIPLNVGYANRSVYLIWTQVWAIVFFNESLTPKNIAGLALVMAGVIVISLSAKNEDDSDDGDNKEVTL